MRFIVKISSESYIKSRSVRAWHIKQLKRNMIKILREIDSTAWVDSMWDRLKVNCAEEYVDACRERLMDIPGISYIHTVDSYDLPEGDPLPFLAEKAIEYFSDSLIDKSFAVRCKREGLHSYKSLDVNIHLGAALLAHCNGSRVQLKNPEVTATLEILHDKVYFIRDSKRGLRGYPYGTQGSVLSMLSGGFDSSVSTYMMMRRGCRVNFLFFNLGGAAHSLGAQQAALYLWQKYGNSHSARFYSVPLDGFVADVMQLPETTFNGVLLKRAMMRVAQDISERIKVDAIVTGESISQVSSQTLANLSVIDKATDNMVVRPLITMDKSDIIDIAEDIGSAVFAKNMVEYCGAISHKPTISAALDKLEEIEQTMGDDWFKDAISRMTNTAVGDILKTLDEQPQVDLVKELNGETVIDIRATSEQLEQAELRIPFHQLNQEFPKLPQDKEYLLFCDKGIMSQLHVAYLHENGFHNVKVFRPEQDSGQDSDPAAE